MSRPVYLDHHATTPLDPRVLEAMRPYWREEFGNPHSVDHVYGWDAEDAVADARRAIAALIGARPAEIVFTSGATEANNLALKGLAAHLRAEGRTHLIVSAIEHPSVGAPAERLEAEGFALTRLAVPASGRLAPEALAAALRPQTGLVSVQWANHEIGTVQPIAELATLCAARGIAFHSDAAQALGTIAVDVAATPLALLSLSAHKLYGPKGIGALYVARPWAGRLTALIEGGGQERGLRAGTLPVPLCVGFGAACRIAAIERAAEAARIAALRARLLAALSAALPGFIVQGDPVHHLPGNLHLRLPGVAAADLIAAVRAEVALSAGAACASAKRAASPILRAIGLDESAAGECVRIGIGRFTTAAEIDRAAAALGAAATRLARAFCPGG